MSDPRKVWLIGYGWDHDIWGVYTSQETAEQEAARMNGDRHWNPDPRINRFYVVESELHDTEPVVSGTED